MNLLTATSWPRRRARRTWLTLGLVATLAACDTGPAPNDSSLRPGAFSADAGAGTTPVLLLSGLVTQALAQITTTQGAPAAAVWTAQIDVLKQAIRDAMTANNTALADQKRAELKAVNLNCVLTGLGNGIVATETQAVQAVMAGVKAALQKGTASAADAGKANAMVITASTLLPGVAPKVQASDWVGALDVATQAGAMIDAARALVGVADPGVGGGTGGGPVYTGNGQYPIEAPTPWAYQAAVPSQSACGGLGTGYDVGPGQSIALLSGVPWLQLKPCDTVRIHYAPTPYHEVIQLGRRGAANKWIRVTGVPGPNGELPVLDGAGATVPAGVSISNPVFEGLGMVLVLPPVGAPYGYKPGYLEISNLEVRGASKRTLLTKTSGQTTPWHPFASGIYIERAEHVVIRNCHLHDNGNGLFQNSKYDEAAQSRDLLVEGTYFHDNGNPGSASEHNAYTEGVGTVYQYNRFGPLMPGALGEDLKERSVGITIRYNSFDATTHLIMLEDPESNHDWEMQQVDAWGHKLVDAVYIYGNEMRMRNPPWGPLPWGITAVEVGDAPPLSGRSGKVYFYHNTVLSEQDGTGYGTPTTSLFALRRPGVQIDGRNNVFLARPATAGVKPRPFAIFYHYGEGSFAGNWISQGWYPADQQVHNPGSIMHFGAKWNGMGWGVNLVSANPSPGFVNLAAGDFHLTAGSPLIGGAVPLDPEVTLTGNLPTMEFAGQGVGVPRTSPSDLGAHGH